MGDMNVLEIVRDGIVDFEFQAQTLREAGIRFQFFSKQLQHLM